VPLPWAWSFHAAAREADNDGGPVEIGAGGARGPGKSHATFAQVGLDDCQRYPGLKVLFLRKTAVSAEESFHDLIEKVFRGTVPYTLTKNVITFNNKSRIVLGGFHNEQDIDKYIGVEYDIIVVEELNQLTEDKLRKLLGSLRTSKPNWRPRLYASFNPGGVGHTLVKTEFVIPRRLRTESKTRFIPATYRNNPHLNKEYIEYLEGLGGDLGRAWRDGDFDLFAGQYFKEWRYDIHVCNPFAIPDDWRRFKAGDAGYNQPSIGWYAVSPDGQLYRYRELYKAQLSYSQLAEQAVAIQNPNEKIEYEVWDPAFWAKKGERDDALSGAEIYAQRIKQLTGKEPRMVKAENSRVVGWGVCREYLRPYLGPNETLTAKFQVFSTCTDFIRTVPELQHDDHNPEDLDTDGEDHTADEWRYAVMSRPKPAINSAQKEEMLFRAKMKAKKKRGESGKLLFVK
jgi:PBSX family phage terminase large subunit